MRLRNVRRAILLRLFDTLYRAGNWLYDPLTVLFFGSSWHEWRRTVLPWVRNGRVLELGCGTGVLLSELANHSSQVVGIDVSTAMLARARKRIADSRISLGQADGTALPFVENSFETVLATFPSGYITTPAARAEVARVLAPGGVFIVVASARFTRFQWKRPFIHPILRIAYGSPTSMNRWPTDLLDHPRIPGGWHDLQTSEGTAYVWIGRKHLNAVG
jgi:ubiquinone/menaquinone biosynthesis C-methylase UbiE